MQQPRSHNQEWNAFRRGDERAYERMFREHYRVLYNYGLKTYNDKEEVKDCIQELFLRLWQSRERLGDCYSVKSYLMASLRRIILRRIKTKHFHADVDNIDPAFTHGTSAEQNKIEEQEERTRIELLAEVLQKIPDRQKEAIYLRYYGELSFEEISEIMGITTRAVYKLIYKALDNLSTELLAKNIKLHHLFSSLWAL